MHAQKLVSLFLKTFQEKLGNPVALCILMTAGNRPVDSTRDPASLLAGSLCGHNFLTSK